MSLTPKKERNNNEKDNLHLNTEIENAEENINNVTVNNFDGKNGQNGNPIEGGEIKDYKINNEEIGSNGNHVKGDLNFD